MKKGTTQKLCSNTCCLNEAVVLEPRHLCEACSKDPKKNGPLFPKGEHQPPKGV